MSAINQASLSVILYEGSGSETFEPATRHAIVREVLDRGFEIIVNHGQDALDLEFEKHYLILGRFAQNPPAANHHGLSLHFENLVDESAGTIGQILDRQSERTKFRQPGKWKPWFPAIDYSRCTNCLQCLSFCLFDVYGVDGEGQIKVQNPSKCKTDCPACSRVCPDVAIIFPKYKNGPINGDRVNEEDLQREKMKVDISSLLGGDIYATLRDRNVRAKSRFSKERDEDKALQERKRCLKELQEKLDIPDEVLASLPDLESIQAKAKKAQGSLKS